MSKDEKFESAHQPAGGWGSVKAVTSDPGAGKGRCCKAARVLLKQNKPDGFACVSCAWAKPAQPHPAEFCENGAKATAWELTSKRVEPGFFQRHTVTELEAWTDHDLEAEGRLTAPMRWDAASDQYLEVPWEEAFAEIGAELKALRPEVGRCSTPPAAPRSRPSYMYQLLARLYGNNNLPDSSNMCHESTSVALPETHRRAGRHGDAGRLRARPTASSSSARTSAPTARACCTSCRRRASAACRSSPSTRCASAGWSASPIRSRRSRC